MPADAASRMSRPEPLTGRLLAILHRDAGRTDADLARLLGAGLPELSAAIGGLYRQGLVDRCAGYLVATPTPHPQKSGTSGTSGTRPGQDPVPGFRRDAEVPEPPEPAEPHPPTEGVTMTTPTHARTPQDTLLKAALCWAGRGWPVFPLRPATKRPAFPNHDAAHCTGTDPRCQAGHTGWEQRATTDPGRITRAWSHAPYNIGIATGPAGLVVIDLDEPKPGQQPPTEWAGPGIRDGSDVLAALCERHSHARGYPDLFGTFLVRTARGGLHLYYTAPAGLRLGNTSGGLGWLIDTRAHGGYVVAAGSAVDLPGGVTGRYQVAYDRPPTELPDWLAGLLAMPAPAAPPLGCRPAGPGQVRELGSYARAALQRECERVRAATTGRRTHALNKAGYHLGQLIAAGVLDQDTAERELLAAASAHAAADEPVTPAEARTSIRGGITAGKRKPRPLATGRAAA